MASALQSLDDTVLQQGLVTRALHKPVASKNMAAIDKAAKDFESMFMAQMLQPMFEGVEVDGMFGGGHGEEIMRGFLVQEYGKAVAQGSHFGLSDAIKDEMIRAQAQSQNQVQAGGSS